MSMSMHVACQYAQAEMMRSRLPEPEHHPTPPIPFPLQEPAGVTCQSGNENGHEWIQYLLIRGTFSKIEFVQPSIPYGGLLKVGIRLADDCCLLLAAPLAPFRKRRSDWDRDASDLGLPHTAGPDSASSSSTLSALKLIEYSRNGFRNTYL